MESNPYESPADIEPESVIPSPREPWPPRIKRASQISAFCFAFVVVMVNARIITWQPQLVKRIAFSGAILSILVMLGSILTMGAKPRRMSAPPRSRVKFRRPGESP